MICVGMFLVMAIVPLRKLLYVDSHAIIHTGYQGHGVHSCYSFLGDELYLVRYIIQWV